MSRRIPRRALAGYLVAVISVAALSGCSDDGDKDPVPTPGAKNISEPRGLTDNGQTARESNSDIAQQVAERLIVRDGVTVDQERAFLVEQGLLADDADAKVDATGLDDVVTRTFQAGQVLNLTEPSKVGRYGELPDTDATVERSVSMALEGISTESIDATDRQKYAATLYVVVSKHEEAWVVTGFRVLSFGEA